MKKFLIAGLLAFGAVFSAQAQQLTANIGLESDFVYRGVNLTPNDDYSLNANLKVDDAFIDGLYFQGQLNSIAVTNGKTDKARFEYGAGYRWDATDRFSLDTSVYRVVNPGVYAYDFTELRVEADYKLTQNLTATALVAHQIDQSAQNDTWVAAGLAYNNFLGFKDLRVGATAGGQYYKNGASKGQYVNTEVFASYLLSERVALYGKYSFGRDGKDRLGRALEDEGTVGIRVLF